MSLNYEHSFRGASLITGGMGCWSSDGVTRCVACVTRYHTWKSQGSGHLSKTPDQLVEYVGEVPIPDFARGPGHTADVNAIS